MAALKITKENFEQEVMQSDIPVLIDFWAPWCGPCQMFSPVIEEIADEVSTTKICKINIDEDSELASKFQVMSIPTLVFLKEGKVVSTTLGVQSKISVLQMIK